MTIEPTLCRRGLDLLLAAHPGFDVISVDWGGDGVVNTDDSPWMLVTLGQPSADGSETWARHRFGIWKTTGAVHGLQHDGSVTEDPLFSP